MILKIQELGLEKTYIYRKLEAQGKLTILGEKTNILNCEGMPMERRMRLAGDSSNCLMPSKGMYGRNPSWLV